MTVPKPKSGAWEARLHLLLTLYADHAWDRRDPPLEVDAFTIGLSLDAFRKARHALVADGRLREVTEGRAHGQSRAYAMTVAGWAAVGRTPPPPDPRGRKSRKCLCCGDQFKSAHIGNRICQPCTRLSAFRDGGSLAW